MPRPKCLTRRRHFASRRDWTYGFPELAPDQADKIRAARKVSNPGCYPTGAIALLRPLVDAGLLPADYPVTINAVSGYSGGGKSMIASFEDGTAPAFELYGLGFEHKHLPEMQLYSNLTRRPIFVPSVGNFRQGMLVSVPLHLDTLPGKPDGADLHAALAKRYAGSNYVSVMPLDNAGFQEREARARGAQRDQQARAVCLCQRQTSSGGSGRAARQSRQGRLGRGRAEHAADARPCRQRRARQQARGRRNAAILSQTTPRPMPDAGQGAIDAADAVSGAVARGRPILELGCGAGNHSAEMLARGICGAPDRRLAGNGRDRSRRLGRPVETHAVS